MRKKIDDVQEHLCLFDEYVDRFGEQLAEGLGQHEQLSVLLSPDTSTTAARQIITAVRDGIARPDATLLPATLQQVLPTAYAPRADESDTKAIAALFTLVRATLLHTFSPAAPQHPTACMTLLSHVDALLSRATEDEFGRMAESHTQVSQQREQTFRNIVEQSSDGIMVTDEEGHLMEWNRGAEYITGLRRADVLGQPYWDVLFQLLPEQHQTPATYEEYETSIREFLQTGQVAWIDHLLEQELQRRDETRLYAEQAAFAIKTSKGYMACSIFRDATKRKEAEEALQRATDEAMEATIAKSRFLANMSHEIRNPLNAIIGAASLLLNTNLPPEQYDLVELAHTSSDALLAIINDILDFSKVEAGGVTLEHHPFDLRRCVEEALDLVSARAAEKQLDLAYLLNDDVPPTFIGDVTRVRQILLNLLSNAVKFTEEGEVVLSVNARLLDEPPPPSTASHNGLDHDTPPPDTALYELHMTVRDTGIGIAPEARDRLFQSFSQVDASITRKYGGTGLGLSICKMFANAMGGRVWVESEVGKGATFHVTLVVEATMEELQQYEHKHISPYLRSRQPLLADKRVLIVDDSATSRFILTHWALSWGMMPWVATSDLEALNWIRRGELFDVGIFDLHLPEIDALTLAAAMRTITTTQKLPLILFVSASLGNAASESSGLHGVIFQTKPIKPTLLYETLVAMVSGVDVGRARRVSQAERLQAFAIRTVADHRALRILLADDNAGSRKVAQLYLKNIGYQSDAVSNGMEVMEALKRQIYDVVMLDVEMPEMDGRETTQRIRKMVAPEYQPWVIAMTAHAMAGDREHFLSLGMDDYVSKPVRIEDLALALKRIPRRAHEQPPTMVVAHPEHRGTEGDNLQLRFVQPRVRRDQRALESMNGKKEEPTDETVPMVGIDPVLFQRFLKPIKQAGPKVVNEIVGTFISNMDQRMDALQKAALQGHAEHLRTAAHSLKSLSAQVGAKTLSDICYTLEQRGEAEELNDISGLVRQVEDEFALTRSVLERELTS